MKIAFLNRGRETHPGGDVIALDATMDALRRRGHTCVETGWDVAAIKAGDFDLCHLFHCQFDWACGNYLAVKEAGKPYVVTPIYYPGLRVINLLDTIQILHDAAVVLPFSAAEQAELPSQYYCKTIPNGTNPAMWDADWTTANGGVVCISARGTSDKNIDIIERICKSIRIRPDIITSESHENICNRLRFSRVFVNASGSERMSLTIGEALCAGCRVLATKHNRGNEWYPGLVTFDPANEIAMEYLIRWALSSPDWDYRPNAAARLLTWDFVAEQLERVYTEVIAR